MKFPRLLELLSDKHSTFLCVGPMSKNCIDAVIDLANEQQVPLGLIASRRQIDCSLLGGGYVMNTPNFAKYVRERDKGDFIFLARDHGGPWQGTNEEDCLYSEAMERALLSFSTDYINGFDCLHIDPSLRRRPLKTIKNDVEILLTAIESMPDKGLVYEVGTEETNGHICDPKDFEDFAKWAVGLSAKIKFAVGQTGTLVKEDRNVGVFDEDAADWLVESCNRNGLFLKEHNLDYASWSVLESHPNIGIHSANIAPELGVAETVFVLKMLKAHKMDKEHDQVLTLAYDSNKWRKWLTKDSILSRCRKAVLAGHYIFNTEEYKDIYRKLAQRCYIDGAVRSHLQYRINGYLKCFGWKTITEHILEDVQAAFS